MWRMLLEASEKPARTAWGQARTGFQRGHLRKAPINPEMPRCIRRPASQSWLSKSPGDVRDRTPHHILCVPKIGFGVDVGNKQVKLAA
jgi:hypothetical protein